jgi:hypothetical protein
MKEKLAESSKKLKDRPPVWQHIFFTDTIVGPFGSSVASPAQAAHSLVAGRPSSSFILYNIIIFWMEHRMTNQVLDPDEEQIAGCMGWGDLCFVDPILQLRGF